MFKVRKAVQLAPGSADVAELASFILAPSGYPEEGLVLLQKAITPQSKPSTHVSRKSGNAYRLSGQIDEAIAAFEAYNARGPGFGLVDLVIAYQENGQTAKAKDAANRLLSARRDFTIAAWLRTQFRRARALLEPTLKRFAPRDLIWAERDFSLPKLARNGRAKISNECLILGCGFNRSVQRRL